MGIAVRSLERTSETYRTGLGLAPSAPEEVASQRVRVTFVRVGSTHLEFLEPTDPGSPVGRFLETRGEGLHHLAFSVPNVDESLRDLAQQGRRLVDSVGRPGARGRRVGFAHPSAFGGVLVELVEKP